MKNNDDNLDKIMEQIFRMYDLYEKFIWNNIDNDYRLKISIDDKLFRIMLLTKDDIIDFFQLKFDSKELELQKYISLSVFRYGFRNIQINKKNNIFFNTIHRLYLKCEVYDNDILKEINKLVVMHNDYSDDLIDNDLSSMHYKLLKNTMIDNKIVDIAKYRVGISKKLSKGDYHG